MSSYSVIIFGLKLVLKPVAFTIKIGDLHWDVYWYGIIIALGFLAALTYAMRNAARFNINADNLLDAALVTTPAAIFCARLYYVLFDGEKLESVGEFFGFGDSSGVSGIAIYGAVIGAFLVGGFMCKLKKLNILNVFDLTAIGFIIGQAIGRWGNFVNQEAFGSLTGSSWWGMESIRTQAVVGEGLVHPCFLYESIWCFIGFFVLHHFSKKRKFYGQILLIYCAWYGFARCFIELLRTDSLMLLGLKVSAVLSFIICIASLITLRVITIKLKEKSAIYESQFQQEKDNQINEIIEETRMNINEQAD